MSGRFVRIAAVVGMAMSFGIGLAVANAEHEWYWFPQQQPNEVSMLKCYDSITDGTVSRWSFHTACIDPTAPADAPCRRNVVVRAFVFF